MELDLAKESGFTYSEAIVLFFSCELDRVLMECSGDPLMT